jgi:hypothetical protein
MSIEKNVQSILEVRKVLIFDWDPIGIFTNCDFQYDYDSYDEYDNYLPEIIKIIDNGGDILDLCKYLEDIEDHMGVEKTSENLLLQVSQKIFNTIGR